MPPPALCGDTRPVQSCRLTGNLYLCRYVDMNSCIHRIPTGDGVRATTWPVSWPARLESTPKWLSSVPKGIYGKPASQEFVADTKHWRNVVTKSYFKTLGIEWPHVRNVMDMNAGYGGYVTSTKNLSLCFARRSSLASRGLISSVFKALRSFRSHRLVCLSVPRRFAAALSTQSVWVMNVVPTDEPDTLPIVYDRGLFGLYHDWCESFSTYPRTYDLLHAGHVFASVKKR